MKLTEKEIKEIAGDLECGMKCYYNLKTNEIKALPNFDDWSDIDMECWEEDYTEIENNWEDYFVFHGFESYESYQIMADFAENIDDTVFQNKLINALNRRKPFQNFKWQIDNSDYRQEWFDYKTKRYIEWVKEQIDLNKED
ncbi:MAG: UPF0158 family protein [Bacteroidales bacterium]|nr:UPF0158 family protein [Bacteroidales bacterium]